MSEKEHSVLNSLGKAIKDLPPEKQEWLSGFAEGIAFMKEQEPQNPPEAD